MRSIHYASRLAALAEGEEIMLSPHIAALEEDHAVRRFVAMLCVYSADVDAGQQPAYSELAAARWARQELMPTMLFIRLVDLRDDQLAEAFAVPHGEVRSRREELGLAAVV